MLYSRVITAGSLFLCCCNLKREIPIPQRWLMCIYKVLLLVVLEPKKNGSNVKWTCLNSVMTRVYSLPICMSVCVSFGISCPSATCLPFTLVKWCVSLCSPVSHLPVILSIVHWPISLCSLTGSCVLHLLSRLPLPGLCFLPASCLFYLDYMLTCFLPMPVSEPCCQPLFPFALLKKLWINWTLESLPVLSCDRFTLC